MALGEPQTITKSDVEKNPSWLGGTQIAKEKEISMAQTPVEKGSYYNSSATRLGKTVIAKEKEIAMKQVPIGGPVSGAGEVPKN